MNDVKHPKTGRWSVAAFKQAVRQLTLPAGYLDAMAGEDRLLAILDLQLPLVAFDPLAAGTADDGAAAAYADRLGEGDASLNAGQGTGEDSQLWVAAARHQPDHTAVQAHRVAGHMPNPSVPAPLSGATDAVNRDGIQPLTIPRIRDGDLSRAEVLPPASISAGAPTGPVEEASKGSIPALRFRGPDTANGTESGNAAIQRRRGQPVDPLMPVARQLRTLTDVLLGPSGIPDKTASGRAHAPSLRQQDDRGPTGQSSSRQVPRAPGRPRPRLENNLPADHRGQRRSVHPVNQALKPKSALEKIDRRDDYIPKARGEGNRHRSVEKIPGRMITPTIELLNALTGQVGQQAAAGNTAAQPEGAAIQTGSRSDGGQANPGTSAPEASPARSTSHAARPLSAMSALPPPEDHMAAERLTDMINDVLVAQARRHGVDLS